MLEYEISRSTWEPLISLKDSPFSNISSRSALFWLKSDPLSIGPSMYLPYKFQELLKLYGLNSDIPIKDLFYSKKDFNSKIRSLRMIIALGHYNTAEEILLNKKENNFFRSCKDLQKYLLNVIKYIRILNENDKIGKENVLKLRFLKPKIKSGKFTILSNLLYLSLFIKTNSDKKKLYSTVNSFLKSVEYAYNDGILSEFENRLILIRLKRHLIDHFFYQNDIIKGELNLQSNLSEIYSLKESINKGDNEKLFLVNELLKRQLSRASFWYLCAKSVSQAVEYSTQLLKIDQNSPKSLLLLAESLYYQKKFGEAKELYFKVYCKGIIERPFAEKRLVELFKSKSVLNTPISAKSIPISNFEIKSIIFSYEGSDKNQIIKSITFKKYKMFWTLEKSKDNNCPNFTQNPLIANSLINKEYDPFFSTIYLQHCFSEGLREQLIYSACEKIKSKILDDKFGFTFSSISNASNQMIFLNEKIQKLSDSSNALEIANILRIIGYLGFNQYSYKLSKKCKIINTTLTPELAYLKYTILFFQYLSGSRVSFNEDCIKLYKILPNEEVYLRTKLTLCISAGVHQARNTFNLKILRMWAGEGLKCLSFIIKSNKFSDFEKSLLKSRFYRFLSFVPYYENNKKELVKMTSIFVSEAEGVQITTKHEDLIFKDNLYAVHESKARVLLFLGEKENALDEIRKATKNADPNDSRLFMQLGEYYEYNHKLEFAINAYDKAAILGPPYKMIAYFKIGNCLERQDKLNEATQYYLKSIETYPPSIEPYFRILEISKRQSNRELFDYCKFCLKQNKSKYEFNNLLKEKINFYITQFAL
jgi:Tfp pilus assembly protein PilF